jgi:ADP-ribosylglycohydrolase
VSASVPAKIRPLSATTSFADRVRGCLIGGAFGDALGAQVELSSWAEIQERFGPRGVTALAPGSPFTDDTQMTLFTAEGLILYSVRGRCRGVASPVGTTQHAYWRWWWTQERQNNEDQPLPAHVDLSGWLAHDRRLHARRGPGKTCLSALATGAQGTVEKPINNSKGSGAVMRAAPIGLMFSSPAAQRAEERAYEVGCEIGALTHGHPDGWGPSGALAHLVSLLVQEVSLAEAVGRTIEITTGNTSHLLRTAAEIAAQGQVSTEVIEHELGSGWSGDEALALAVACSLGFEDRKQSLLAAVNHSGDSDSTGAICGNLLGALHGMKAHEASRLGGWPTALLDLELVQLVAEDFALEVTDPPMAGRHETWYEGQVPPWWLLRYPGG